MAVNPLELLKMRERLKVFGQQHPRFPAFLHELHTQALEPGTILEIKATTPEGKELITNIRLTEEDVKTIQMAQALRS